MTDSGREHARCAGEMCLRLFGRLPFNRSAPCNWRLCGCWLFTVRHPGTGGWVGWHGHVDGSCMVILVMDAGQQELGCGGQKRSVLLGRLPFERSLPWHGRLRCGCRSTVQHPGSCGCALLSESESRNMLVAPGTEVGDVWAVAVPPFSLGTGGFEWHPLAGIVGCCGQSLWIWMVSWCSIVEDPWTGGDAWHHRHVDGRATSFE